MIRCLSLRITYVEKIEKPIYVYEVTSKMRLLYFFFYSSTETWTVNRKTYNNNKSSIVARYVAIQ